MGTTEEHSRIESAIQAFHNNQSVLAREIIASVLIKNPGNVDGWIWACEFSSTAAEKITCLKRIITLDPENKAARLYLEKLSPASEPDKPKLFTPPFFEDILPLPVKPQAGPFTAGPAPEIQRRKGGPKLLDFLLYPFGVLISIPPFVPIGLMVIGLMVYGYLYFETNYVAISGPDFDHLTISSSFQDISSPDGVWKMTYEKPVDSHFAGLVRYISVDRVDMFSILSHDVLLTTGDYANSSLVSTFVDNHHFSWRSTSTVSPNGTINLLHIVPVSKDIYQKLIKIKNGDRVAMGGHEIFKIDYYDKSGAFKGYWSDTGCNSIVVSSVDFLNPPIQGQ